MKFRKLAIYTMAITLLGGVASCESPLKDFNLQISTEVIRQYATLRVVNTSGATVENTSISLLSGDTDDIYNLEGRKEFRLTDNLVSFGLDPARTATSAAPIRFRVQISAPGYSTQVVPVAITDASTGIETVVLTQPVTLPDAAEQVVENVPLATNGSTLAATTVLVPSATAGTTGALNLVIPAGTQFLNAAGTVITGSAVRIEVTSIDVYDEDAVALLPGGQLFSDEVVLENGTTVSGAFASAAVVDIKMLVSGQEVRSFSQPITLRMPVSSTFVSPTSGLPLATGNVLQVFSHSDAEAAWRWEAAHPTEGAAGSGYFVNFPISHLSYYLVGEFGQACASARTVTFTGDWMSNGSTYPINVEVWWGGKRMRNITHSVSQSNNQISLVNIPETGAHIVVKTGAGQELEQAPLGACAEVTTLQLPNPGNATGTISTLQLYVRCPDATSTITLLPTFQMFYRETGTAEFKYLGAVDNGFLRTTLLKTDGTRYDFKAIWKSHVKTVGGKTIQEDNTATVGIGPGDIIGTKGGATNLAILTEECKNL